MRSLGTGKVRAQLVTSVGMLALTAGAALAQQATPPVTPPTVVAQNAPDQQASAAGLETVVVSASRISIAGYEAPTPVSVIGAEALQQAANADIGQTLRQLPMMGTAQSPQNATQGNAGNSGAVGISSVNLRNLGVVRTLVLVDGEREVWAGVQYGVDLNTIPRDLIQRVDVVTGGASAAWGSDAVAGVVNLIINKNFTGLKASIDLQDTGDDTRRQYGFTVTNGFNLLGDKAHIEWAVTYDHAPNTVYMAQQRWFNNPALVANPAYNAVTNPNVPKLIHMNNVGNSSTPGGIISSATVNNAAGTASTALNGIQFGPGGAISNFAIPNCNYYSNTALPPYSATTTTTIEHGVLWRFDQQVELPVADRSGVLSAPDGIGLLQWQLQIHAGYPGIRDLAVQQGPGHRLESDNSGKRRRSSGTTPSCRSRHFTGPGWAQLGHEIHHRHQRRHCQLAGRLHTAHPRNEPKAIRKRHRHAGGRDQPPILSRALQPGRRTWQRLVVERQLPAQRNPSARALQLHPDHAELCQCG